MRRTLAAMLCVALLLCGCGTPQTPYVPTGDALVPDGPQAPTEPVVTRQALYLAYHPDHSLDPMRCTDYTDRTLFGLVYQGLFAVDGDYNAVPILCAGVRQSPDLMEYAFRLEKATFSDGTLLTAADAVASLKAAQKSNVYGGRFSHVEDIRAEEEEVVIELAEPCEDLPLLLDIPILKADQIGTDRPLGTGPYVFDGDCLRRRADWWCAAALPVTAEEITLVEAGDPAALRDAFEAGKLSMVVTAPGDESYVDLHTDHELWESHSGQFLYLGINDDSYVLSKKSIRQGLPFAIDRQMIADEYYKGFARPVTLPADPDHPAYDATLADAVSFDPQKLTDGVKTAGLEEDDPIVLLVNNDDGVRLRVARYIAATLEGCGLKVTISAPNGEGFRTALEEGQYDLYLGQTRLTADMDLSAFYGPEGTLSYGNIADEKTYGMCLDMLANKGNAATLYRKVLEQGDILPILFRSYAIYTHRGLFPDLTPARDQVFFYTTGKTLSQILVQSAEQTDRT